MSVPKPKEINGMVEAEDEAVEKPKRKLNKWQRYIKVNKNKIFYKSGKNKGKLNLKAMAKAGGFGKKGGKK